MKKWTKEIKSDWIKNEIVDDTIDWCQEFGHYLAEDFQRDDNNDPIPDIDQNTRKQKIKKGKLVWKQQNPLTTSQLRKIFAQIRHIQTELQLNEKFSKTEIILLKPKLAYQVGREKDKNGKVRDFYSQISKAIDLINDRKEFERFVKITEAIVAYHKEKESEKSEIEVVEEN